MLDKFHKKEKPFQGLAGMGGGVVSRVLGGPTVSASGAFAAWGGGGGGGQEGSYGGGGGAVVGSLTLAAGDYTFIVGSKGCSFDSPTSGFGGAPERQGNGGGGGGFSGIFAGNLTPFSFLGGGPNPDPSPNRDTAHAAAIMLSGGGGAAGQEPAPAVGGGGGGGTNGDAGDPGQGGGGTQSAGGTAGPGDAGAGSAGSKLLGGFGGSASGGGGGGYYGGGSGGAQTGNGVEAGGGGSGYINPSYGTATLTTGSPGKNSNGAAAATPSPYYPGSAGVSGAGRPHSTRDSTAGAFVIGPYSGGSISVTPPGGSPSPVPTSGQAFNTAGKYLLVVVVS